MEHVGKKSICVILIPYMYSVEQPNSCTLKLWAAQDYYMCILATALLLEVAIISICD